MYLKVNPNALCLLKYLFFTSKTIWHLHSTNFFASLLLHSLSGLTLFTDIELAKNDGREGNLCLLFFFFSFLTHIRIKLCTVKHYICALQEMESIQVWYPAIHQTPSRSGSLAATIKICYL